MAFSKILNRIIYGLLLLTTLTPLIYQKKLFFPYDSEKGLFFRFLSEIILGLWLILVMKDASFRPKRNPITLALLAFGIMLIIVDILGVDTYLSVFSNFERMSGLILYLSVISYGFVISSIINTPKRWVIFGIFLSVIAFIVSVKGIIQSYDSEAMLLNAGRVVGTVGNANQLASYLILGFFVVGLLISEWILPMKKTKSILSILLLTISIIFLIIYAFCLLKTSTRGSLIGLIIGGGLMLILMILNVKNRRFRIITSSLLSILIILIASLFYFRKSNFIQQNSALNRITRIADKDGTNTLQSRLENYKVALEGIKAKPFLGWGQETYHYTYAQYFNPKLYADATWYDRVHNVILEWLIIGGMFGLLAYLWLWGAVLFQLWQKGNRLNIKTKIILSGFLMAYFIGNLSLFDNLLSLMAFMAVIGFIENQSAQIDIKNDKIFNPKTGWIFSFIIIILTVFTLKITCQQAYQTNQEIVKAYSAGSLEEVIEIYAQAYPKAIIGKQEIAEQLANLAKEVANNPVPEATKQRYFEAARNIMSSEIKQHPNYARLQIIYGNLLEAQGDNAEVVKTFEKVQTLAPKRQGSLIQLAMAYARNKEYDRANGLLEKTYLLASNNEEPRVYQAIVYAMANQKYKRSIILNRLPSKAIGRYRDSIKYAYLLTNDVPEYLQLLHCGNPSEIFDLNVPNEFDIQFRDWANTAFSIKDYEEVSHAVIVYRLQNLGVKFKDNRALDFIAKDIRQGTNPSFVFERGGF